MTENLLSESGFASYAQRAENSRGRTHPEAEHPFRSLYQRDRDRIIHSTAFRRLEYKTQVFVNHEGDHYRTRLTHTMEVSQISRTIARELCLNEDLTEAIALAHDLGHTPFGHSGEEAMNKLMSENGGFEHNTQGLRVVTTLEKRYSDFPGLNLSYEVREAFLRHHTPHDHPVLLKEYDLSGGALLEAQATVIADEIAYDNHDIDDGLFSGILHESDLRELEIWRRVVSQISNYDSLSPELKRVEGVRHLINLLVTDVIKTTRENLKTQNITTRDDVLACRVPLVTSSLELAPLKRELEEYLLDTFYRDYRVMRMANKAQHFLRDLFSAYVEEPRILPRDHQEIANERGLHRTVADYIAGMTDRFAEEEYRKLFHPFKKT